VGGEGSRGPRGRTPGAHCGRAALPAPPGSRGQVCGRCGAPWSFAGGVRFDRRTRVSIFSSPRSAGSMRGRGTACLRIATSGAGRPGARAFEAHPFGARTATSVIKLFAGGFHSHTRDAANCGAAGALQRSTEATELPDMLKNAAAGGKLAVESTSMRSGERCKSASVARVAGSRNCCMAAGSKQAPGPRREPGSGARWRGLGSPGAIEKADRRGRLGAGRPRTA